jgi:hypothetical protein
MSIKDILKKVSNKDNSKLKIDPFLFMIIKWKDDHLRQEED